MTRTEFTRLLGRELRRLSMPFTHAYLEAFVEAAWPQIEDEPDIGQWAWEFIGQVVTVELEEAVA